MTPKAYWDKRARGLGATPERPAVSCGEENLLNLQGDWYPGRTSSSMNSPTRSTSWA